MHPTIHGPIRHVMTVGVKTLPPTARPSELAHLLRQNPFHHVPIVENGRLLGIVSAFDLAKVSLDAWVGDAETGDAEIDARFKITDLMTANPQAIDASAPAWRAAEILAEGYFHALPVVDGDQLVGIVTTTDLLRLMVAG
jgi:CBS domain-containing protein